GICSNGNGQDGTCQTGGIVEECGDGCSGGECNPTSEEQEDDETGCTTDTDCSEKCPSGKKCVCVEGECSIKDETSPPEEEGTTPPPGRKGVIGETCTSSAGCVSGYCENSVCIEPPSKTKSCTKGYHLDPSSGKCVKDPPNDEQKDSSLPIIGGAIDIFKMFWRGEGPGGEASAGFLKGLTHASTIYGAVQMFSPMFGATPDQTNALSLALGMGVLVGQTVKGGVLKIWENWGATGKFSNAGLVGAGAGAATAIVIFLIMYNEEDAKLKTFECVAWQAPFGGDDCHKCNEQGEGIPCSEYQCRSLGAACELLNPEEAGEQICEWVNRNDVTPPVMMAWEGALLSDEYSYNPYNTRSPPDKGVEIKYSESENNCIPAFTPLSFGINTDEAAQCKLDYLNKKTLEEMQFYFGGSSLFKFNHTQIMSLPGPEALAEANITIQNGGEVELFVRCADVNGNYDKANLRFKFCVDDSEDTTPPLITGTNIPTQSPIAFNQTSVDIEVYTNEPADCKWSILDQSYDDMLEENEMECTQTVDQMKMINGLPVGVCKTTLDGLKNREENKFYFRCRDKPRAEIDKRNTNTESYEYVLIGTQPLIIDWIKPNETVRDSTERVKVKLEAKTSTGYNEGAAICSYEDQDGNGDKFSNTGSHEHSQELLLVEGEYNYKINCVDLGGNSDEKTTEFRVESDNEAPLVVRVYYEANYLKLITDETAECVYDNVDCSYPFDQGIEMRVIDDINHFTEWDPNKNFYIKCKDEYGNQPNPNECSIIVRPFE
ncbi:hypothetical protein ACFL0X_02825, partial [Nanoarchaeota archaeon]